MIDSLQAKSKQELLMQSNRSSKSKDIIYTPVKNTKAEFSGTKESSQFSANYYSKKNFKHGVQSAFFSINDEQVPVEEELALQNLTPVVITTAPRLRLEVSLILLFG